jgi:CheY-like chemotaxis protein
LERCGYLATSETQVLKALEHVERNPEQFQMIVTDQSMPGLSGADFAHRIHTINPNLPIVIVSGYATALTAQQLAKAGVRPVLQKPHSEDELAQAIYQLLNPQH